MQIHKINSEQVALREKFRAYYNQNLIHDYEELEPARKKHLSTFFLWLVIFTFLGLLLFRGCAGGHICFDNADNDLMEILTSVYLVAAGYFLSSPFRRYKEETKDKVMNKVLSFFGTFTYSNNTGGSVSEAIIKKSGLIGEYTERNFDDYFSGTYKDIAITVSEQKIKRVTGSGKNRRSVALFKGIFILLDMPKKFTGKTVAHAKGMNWLEISRSFGVIVSVLGILVIFAISFFPFFSHPELFKEYCSAFFFSLFFGLFCLFIITFPFFRKTNKSMQAVYLEDIIFGKHWNVKATDQVEARYVLTTALMERMLEIKRRFSGKKIEFSFFGNQVLIAVHTGKDMFETTSLFIPALSYHKVQEVISQFGCIFATAELLHK